VSDELAWTKVYITVIAIAVVTVLMLAWFGEAFG